LVKILKDAGSGDIPVGTAIALSVAEEDELEAWNKVRE
jgi:hypothetical protein